MYPTKHVTLNLSEQEAEILLHHWNRNINYQEGGTFGDGEKITSKKDYKVAKQIMERLKIAIYHFNNPF